ncbi:TRAP transporter substrate-binding protein [Ornithinimicrobium avium]|uniref:TRAP transporter substrate-binding protein n=1 Tax=Ornithinimicrobium avium TaxID=2283195 RepID=A0A345NIY0_9MICO|nr:TRAP transporter substrate-binding protein [Ornithinimicrobium avium]AXH94988.1 TRAP transporter substrate-binding protein [Ornithinimicrobium avium]
MRTTSRLALTGIATAAALTLAACGGSGDGAGAGGDGKTMKLALNQTEDHPSYIALEAFGEDLNEATDGRWDIEVYPNATLGAQDETIQLVSDGSVDLSIVSAPQLENLNDDFVVFSLPTVFDSVDSQMSIINDADVVGDVYASLEDSQNFSVVGGITQGARSFYTKDGPVQTPADMQGLKIRVQESPVFISMMKALGASATPMAFGEVYTGLQSGVIDGAENNEVSYFTQKHFEVAPYFSYTRHLIGADFLIASTPVLDAMSQEDRAAFDEAWQNTWKYHTELWNEATEKAITDAESGGATFTEVDAGAFADALSPMIEEFVTTDTQRALYDGIKAAGE